MLLAVSGGVDSVVLLHLLAQINAWKIHVAHFNHCLRGAESDADESFVQALAERLRLPFVAGRGDVKAFADQHGISIEMAARELRHNFLADSAAALRLHRIALAHHADDQVETFWLRLLRGDVGPGLTGMRWQRSVRPGSDISLIRPLLEIPKADLVNFAREQVINYRDDSSNSSPDFLRNRLRLELIARLKTFQPALREVTLRTASVLAAEKNFLEQSARAWLEAKAPAFDQLHPALQREVVRLQLLQHNVKPNFELIESLRSSPRIPISTSSTQTIIRTDAGLLSVEQRSAITFSEGTTSINIESPGRASFEAFDLEWNFVAQRGALARGTEFFDADALGPKITVRHWQRGDRFQPIGMAGPAKLQDLFTNWKIPAAEKRRRLLAADSRGRIFWVEGLRISELHKVTSTTARVLKWAWQRRL